MARAATPGCSRSAGLSVRRTDIASGFVRLLSADGYAADTVDPLTDDLADPERDAPYDGVWAAASLIHVRREDFPHVVRRLADASPHAGGVLHLAMKEGDGARFSTHGNVHAPRHFTFWREPGLRAVLEEAGWSVTGRRPGHEPARRGVARRDRCRMSDPVRRTA